MTKALRIDAPARAELRAAARWYQDRVDGLGIEFLESIEHAFVQVSELGPEARPVLGVPSALNVQRVLVKRFPFSVIFIELQAAIRIIAVMHQRQKPGYWLDRL